MAAHRVTAQHIAYLATGPKVADGRRRDVLVDTDSGIALVTSDNVLGAPGVRRLLMTRTELVEDAAAAGMTPSAYARKHSARIAADLNALIAQD